MPFLFEQNTSFTTLEHIRSFQEAKLLELLKYLQDHSPFYKKTLKKHSFGNSFSLKDLSSLPITTKEDLQDGNMDFLCVPIENVMEYVTTTGTTGRPVTIALTENDLERLAYNEYLSYVHAGVTSSDILLLTVTNDRCFMAGRAYTLGARKMGAAVIRTGPGLPELQWDTILRLKPTVLVAVPSFIFKLIDYAEKHQIDYHQSSIKKAICIGESVRTETFELNELGKKILEKWSIELFSTYASTEMATAFTECKEGKGGHLNPELLIVECLDDKGKPVAVGEAGEIVVTTLGIQGMPLLRFETGDMATLHHSTCSCGNPSIRLGPIIGRKKQMVKYKGTTLYPPAIKEIMHGLGLGDSYFVEVSLDDLNTDKLSLYLPEELREMEKDLRDTFKARLRVVPYFVFANKSDIDKVRLNPRSRKPVDFVDKRG